MIGKLIRLLPWIFLAWILWQAINPQLRNDIHRSVHIAAIVLLLASCVALGWHLLH
ncbi:hypothetical protein IGB42_00895 [Andreprevotia sp. IGB-42]|uniref:protein MIGRI n=1 Tax=Andreprevotia sp. IGB-42 TaxID=2497473 RepID=UPI00135C3643|nr:hypothetical protein [Andreprevotia sp. IGB-42]KAF0814840.1 hypothetical protein IGB42_00895 [Andreprevotia sp. IGB-42]